MNGISGSDLPGAPPRVSLAHLPTRVQPLERLSAELPVELWIKRDDETGSDLSGNKVRKLEYLLAEAVSVGAEVVLTCGGIQSNHCRATAVAARRLGLDSILFLRGQDPGSPDGNLLLDRLVGAEVRFVTPEQYADRTRVLQEAADEVVARGRPAYVIPEGGSNALGAWGYIGLLAELLRQVGSESGGPGASGGDGSFPWEHVVCATGSGGTLAGLVLGARLLGLDGVRMWGIPVCDDGAYFQRKVLEISSDFIARFGVGPDGQLARPIGTSEIGVLDGYKGPAYAVPFAEELDLVREVARRDGLFLDPVYTGKAFFGLLEEAKRGRFGSGRVLFLHTGGIFSLFAFREALFPSNG